MHFDLLEGRALHILTHGHVPVHIPGCGLSVQLCTTESICFQPARRQECRESLDTGSFDGKPCQSAGITS